MVIFSVVSGACKSILTILISNLLTSWFLGALSVFHILTFEMNFCPCTWAFMSHALIGRWTHSTSLRSLLWVHARNANTFTWLTFKWTQLQSCTETQSVKDPHLSLHLERGSRQSCLCARRRGCCCLRYTAERSCRRVWEEREKWSSHPSAERRLWAPHGEAAARRVSRRSSNQCGVRGREGAVTTEQLYPGS